MGKVAYILNDENKYIGEGIEDFGISYVNKTYTAPDKNFLNGDYDVVWNGKEWEYIKVKGVEEVKTFDTPEPTEEEIKAMEAENERLRQEWLKQQANDIFPHIWELVEKKLNELGIIQNKNIGEE